MRLAYDDVGFMMPLLQGLLGNQSRCRMMTTTWRAKLVKNFLLVARVACEGILGGYVYHLDGHLT
jgi:hypothetical protein